VSLGQIGITVDGLFELRDGVLDETLSSIGQPEVVMEDGRLGFEKDAFLEELDVGVEV